MAQSNASQMYTCALSGLSPITDPVVTPSGYICSRKLLLTKLSENGGVDPFDDRGGGGGNDRPRRSLDESQLIDLAIATTTSSSSSSSSAAPLPPRPPKATSLPSLLTLLREEFDAVLLELYDTRKALEETRRELSSALYQNDAAVRVVARVVRERDEARGALERCLKEGGSGGKRTAERDVAEGEVETEVEAPAKRAKTAPASDAEADPREDADAMIATWKSLSKLRKAQTKRHKKSDEQLRAYRSLLRSRWSELQKVNLHRSSADAGVLCLATVAATATEGEEAPKEEYVVSGGRDGQAVVYDVGRGVILATLAKCPGQIACVAGAVIGGNDGDNASSSSFVAVVTGSDDGTIRLHSLPSGRDQPILLAERNFDSSPVVSAVIHPSSDNHVVRLIVATRNGKIALIKYRLAGGEPGKLETVFELTRQEKEKEDVYTAGALHPDGLIYAAGTDEGKIMIWDLKTKALAGTLESNDQNSIDCIAFSENGYHVATSSSAPSTAIQIWDLRKLQSIATIHPNGKDGNGDGDDMDGDDANGNTRVDIGRISSVAFDPSGVFLAYSGEGGTKVCVVKNVDDVVCALIPSKTGGRKSKKKDEAGAFRGGVVWGGVGTAGAEEKVWCASGCDGERPLRIWGVPATE